MSAGDFVHLHVHSDYSLLHSALRVRELAARAREFGMPAVALTDHGNLFGALEFREACKEQGVRPIFGMEAFLAERAGAVAHPIVLLVTQATGWRNLMRLSSFGYLEGLSERPTITHQQLREHAEGLLALSGGRRSEVWRQLAEGDLHAARSAACALVDIIGSENFYLEIQNHGLPQEKRVRELAAQLASELGLSLVATHNCHYLHPHQREAHDVLIAIQQQRTVDDPARSTYEGEPYHFADGDEMRARFRDFPDAIENTLRIAERCQFELKLGEHLLPRFPLPAGYASPEAYLEALARQGTLARYGRIDETLERRLTYELGVIAQTGFAGYFLITGDFVQFAREHGIPVGPGRGSAAGSLVCYAIGITDIDPIAHGLLFERFLNPERVSMPDIDIDFCFERRGEVIDYVIAKYGKESVCQIITYGTMLARGVVRDVGRALGLSYGETDRIAKLVPEQLGITLRKALEDTPELRAVREEDPRYDRLLSTALELEGLHRHSSIHAAGILIAPGRLIDHVPLHRTAKDELTTQWDMKMCEKAGLLKMDFLGLRTLTVIERALDCIGEMTGKRPSTAEIPLEDPAIFDLLGRGLTVGVFQLESSGMREVLRKLKPSRFEDITAVNALFRPGPLGSGMVDDFVDCKHGRKPIRYLHPMLEQVLEPTYGVILYQEQVMRIASEMAGFSLGDADKLRRAMGKKNAAEMAKQKARFLDGAKQRQVPAPIAAEIFDLMEHFAGYGFNKSHSASYAVLSARTAWLKAKHPAAFLAATLTSEMNSTDRVVVLLEDLRRIGIAILPPDIHRSNFEFVVQDGAVRFGLGAIKNVGQGAVESILAARQRLGGRFQSLYQFCEEIDPARLNRRVVESLVLAGAMDGLPGRREQKLAALDLALARAQRLQRDKERGQVSLFGGDTQREGTPADGALPEVPKVDRIESLRRERELIGLYLSGHPLDQHAPTIDRLGVRRCIDVDDSSQDEVVPLCGIVSGIQTRTTRRSNHLMAFVTLEDLSGARELLCFHEPYLRHRDLLHSDTPLLVFCRATRREGDETARWVIEKVLSLDDACVALARHVELVLPEQVGDCDADRLVELLHQHPGERPLYLRVERSGFAAQLVAQRGVRPQLALLAELREMLGEGRVQVEFAPVSTLAPQAPAWKTARKERQAAG